MIDELSHPYRMALLQNKGPEAYLKQINIDIARVVNRLQFRIGEAKPGTAATLLQLKHRWNQKNYPASSIGIKYGAILNSSMRQQA